MTLVTTRRPQRQGFGGISESWRSVIDLFRNLYIDADQEQRVALVNNHYQLLWRATRQAQMPTDLPVIQKLLTTMDGWWRWKLQYDDAVLRRWVPFTRDWDQELDQWALKWEQLVTEIDAVAPQVPLILEGRGVSAEQIKPDAWTTAGHEFLKRLNEILGSSWFWPVVGTVTAVFVAGKILSLYKSIKEEFR